MSIVKDKNSGNFNENSVNKDSNSKTNLNKNNINLDNKKDRSNLGNKLKQKIKKLKTYKKGNENNKRDKKIKKNKKKSLKDETKSFIKSSVQFIKNPKNVIKQKIEKIKKKIERGKKYYGFFKVAGLSKKFIIATILYRFIAGILQGIGIVLLIPIARGIITNDFMFVTKTSIYQKLVEYFPIMSTANNTAVFIILTTIIFLATILKSLINYFAELNLNKKRFSIASKTNSFVFNKYIRLGKPFYDKSNGGAESSLFLRLALLMDRLLGIIDSVADIVIQSVTLSFIMIFISVRIYLISLMLIPLFFIFNKRLVDNIRKSAQLEIDAEMSFPIQVNNTFVRMPLAFIKNNIPFEKKVFSDFCSVFERKKFEFQKRMSLLEPTNEIILFLILLLCAIFLSVFTNKGFFDPAQGVIFFLTYRQFIITVKKAITVNINFSRSVKVLTATLDSLEKSEPLIINEGRDSFKGLEREIEIKNLIFKYDKGPNVLKRINLKINKEQLIGIIGKTGSGKSTLVNLLLRLYDCPPNTIFLDGKDIRKYSITSIRKQIIYISQEPILFHDTLFNNIVYGTKKKVSQDQVIEIMKLISMYDYVKSLKNGLNTNIGDRGVTLSGGEKQRIALARALLSDAKIVILDEPTSSLDALTESEIQAVLDNFIKKKTVIIIAHRLTTIKRVDNVFLMEDGKIIESGTVQSLLRKNTRFRQYWDSQKLSPTESEITTDKEIELSNKIKRAKEKNEIIVIDPTQEKNSILLFKKDNKTLLDTIESKRLQMEKLQKIRLQKLRQQNNQGINDDNNKEINQDKREITRKKNLKTKNLIKVIKK